VRLLTAALLLALCVRPAAPAAGFPEGAAPADAWPQFRGLTALTGVSAAAIPERPKLLWTWDGGESVESSAAIAGGTVYVGTRAAGLVALDLATGTLRWKYAVGEQGIGESSPAVGDGAVYVGDLDGKVHAVSMEGGRRLWTFETGTEIKASPVLAGGRVLVGSYDGHLYALDALTGALAWKVETQGPVHGTAAVAEGIAYVAGCDERFRGVRIRDGRQVVEVSSGAYTGASPALVGSSAYYGTFENEVLKVDLAGGKIAWRYQSRDRQFPFYSSAAVADGKVVLGGRDKRVHGLDAETGALLWTFATQARVESSPAVARGRVYVGSNDGRLYALDLATGAKLWDFEAGAPLSASPALAAGLIVIGSQDGRVFCLG